VAAAETDHREEESAGTERLAQLDETGLGAARRAEKIGADLLQGGRTPTDHLQADRDWSETATRPAVPPLGEVLRFAYLP